jgi:hypothetical protein
MAQTDRVFSGSIPALYERYLGPLIFEPYADLMAERVAAGAHSRNRGGDRNPHAGACPSAAVPM